MLYYYANLCNESFHSQPTVGPVHSLVADSGCTNTLLKNADKPLLYQPTPDSTLRVSLPNGFQICSDIVGRLPLTAALSIPAHGFRDSDLKHSLLSLSELCSYGCNISLMRTAITVLYEGVTILSGTKAPDAGLWTIELSSAPPTTAAAPAPHLVSWALSGSPTPLYSTISPEHGMANSVVRCQNDADYVVWAHASFGAPPISSFLGAADAKYLGNYPRITPKLIRQNEPHVPQTALGHLNQTRQGQRSTKSPKPVREQQRPQPLPTTITEPDEEPDTLVGIVVKIICAEDIRLYADATGRFPYTSRKGTKYLLLFTWDSYRT